MRKKLYSCVFVVSLLFTSVSALATAPTVPASALNFSFIEGGSLRLNWTNGNGAQRLVIAKMNSPVTAVPVNGVDYLSNTAFGQGFQIAPGEFVVGKIPFSNLDITALQPATQYYFAVFEFNGTGASTEYITTAGTSNGSTLSAPTIQATNVTITNIIGNSMKINWTNGNGARRIVIMKQGSAVDVNPADLNPYNPSSQFGSGSQIGSGNYVMFLSTSNNVTVTNLDPNTLYHVAVFEANGSTTPVYLTTNAARGNATTLPHPTVPASGTSISFIETQTLRVNWTSGNGTRRIVVARAGQPVDAVPVDGVDYLTGSTTSAPFTTAPEITPGQKVVYDNTSFIADISGLTYGTTYYFRIYEYDGSGTNIGYLTSLYATASGSTLSIPTVQASNILFSNITATTMQLNWTAGNGSGRIVLAKAGAPVDAVPVNLTTYNANTSFGSGTQLGSGNFVVSNSGANTVNVTNLSTNVTYYFAVFETNGTTNQVYLTTSPATGSQATSNRPTIPSSGLFFNSLEGASMQLGWTSGNGAKRIVVARANQPVDAVPVDGVDYLAGTTSPFNTAPEITPGQKVIYNGNSTGFNASGLSPNTTYYYRVYEYDGTGSQIKYLTTSFASGSSPTQSTPTTPASNVTFSNVSSNSLQVNWTNGNGVRRIVIIKAGSPVDAVPTDLSIYNANPTYGSGTEITTGNYVVYSNFGNSVNVTNLTLNTQYYFAVYEYNGISQPVYLASGPATNHITTASQPTVPSSALSFSSIEGNSFSLSWTSGNGLRRIVVARASQPVDAIPVNGIDYLAGNSSPFNTAPEITPGQKVIFDNSNNSVSVTGLSPSTVYYFKVFEYDGTGSSIAYLTSNPGSGNASTLSDPTIQAAAVSFTSVTSNSMTVSWTNGNGAGRIALIHQGASVNSDPVDLTNYSPGSTYGSGTQIGTGNYVIYKNFSNSVNIIGLTAGTTYYVNVYEFNGNGAPMYLTPGTSGQVTTIGPPATPATNANTSSVTNTSVQLGWTNGSGNRRIVLMKQGSAVNGTPANNIHYFANTFFGSGQQIGSGNYVVYDGTQNTVTVTNLQPNNTYYFSVFEYNDFGATTQVLTTSPASGNFNTVVLPVVLIEFKANVEKDFVNLTWATAQEQNSDYFSIERSANGINFIETGRVQSKGNSTVRTDYHFADRTPFDGDNYYRLKQVDKDGTTSYSFIVHIKFNSEKIIRKMISPVTNQLQIDLFKQPMSSDYMVIYNAAGQVVQKTNLSSTHIDINVSSIASGMYIAEIHTRNLIERTKFIKQ